jgi:hypothetical protein
MDCPLARPVNPAFFILHSAFCLPAFAVYAKQKGRDNARPLFDLLHPEARYRFSFAPQKRVGE